MRLRRPPLRLLLGILALLGLPAVPAHASGPRYVTGHPYFTTGSGRPIGWRQPVLLYSTDPGDLSASVNHAAADALVAAAASAWNVPVASITVQRGGALAEHVSGANTYLDSNGMEYPPDVARSNEAAIPLAVIYDSDGSVTETLLGSGASAPTACRANAVTESVDDFDPAGYISHAVLILNGRCTGAAPEKQLEMQYKLTRMLGRVLGLAWSQANDNVFTGTPQPTYDQALHWPLLHPIDINCGPYAYQCLPNPFTPRPDDLASLVLVYPNPDGAALAPGKQASLAQGNGLQGTISFPDGQGMAGVNVLLRRAYSASTNVDAWVEASAVTGTTFRRAAQAPFTVWPSDALGSMGDGGQDQPGLYRVTYMPLLSGVSSESIVATYEPVNPLYARGLALGPYGPGAVAPSGSLPAPVTLLGIGADQIAETDFAVADAWKPCGNGADGTTQSPAEVPATGWWQASLCPFAHASNFTFNVRPGRTFTMEATALGPDGLATTTKAMPVLGLYAQTDPAYALPSLGVTAAAFQGLAVATTEFRASTGNATQLRLAVADQRGEGRPDFLYQGRVFYADMVEPARIPAAGGVVTITGMGFRLGNAVLVNGVAASVSNWTPTSITATLPALAAAHAIAGTALDVAVLDHGTGATSVMSQALTYDASASLPGAMILVSAPAGTVVVGAAAAPAFSVRLVAADGVTAMAGVAVTLSASPAGSVAFAGCGAAACRLTSDANGLVSSVLTAASAGALTVTAQAGSLLQSAAFQAENAPASMIITDQPPATVNVGQAQGEPFQVRLLAAQGYGLASRPVTFSVVSGNAIFDSCFAASCTIASDNNGFAAVNITATAAGPVVLAAANDGVSVQITLNALAFADTLSLFFAPTPSVNVNQYTSTFAVRLLHGDGSGFGGQTVTFTSTASSVLFANCGTPVCPFTTSSGGFAYTQIYPTQAGTFTLTATYGTHTVTVPLTVTVPVRTIRIVSAPAGNVPVGVATSVPFAAEVIDLDGVTPVAGAVFGLEGPDDSIALGLCGHGSCLGSANAQGILASSVTPIKAGTITLTAIFGQLVATTSFTAVSATDTLQVLTQPFYTAVLTGTAQTFTAQLLKPDGTPDAGKSVSFTVAGGALQFAECAASACSGMTDGKGQVTLHGAPVTAGVVTIDVAYAGLLQVIQLTAAARPDVLQVVSAPVSPAFTGDVAAAPFSVRALLSDGVTPAAGQTLTFSVAAGAARLGACGTSVCTAVADASGLVSTSVTPLAAGPVSLLAAVGASSVTAGFAAVDHPDTMTLVSAPAGPVFVGDVAQPAFAVRVSTYAGAPLAGRAVSFTSSGAAAALAGCPATACVVLTDATGTAAVSVTPGAAGNHHPAGGEHGQHGCGAQPGHLVQRGNAASECADAGLSPADGALVGDPAVTPFSVRLTAADGVTPRAGQAVGFSVARGTAAFAGCTSPCVVNTDASGLASVSVIPGAAGSITLQAAAEALAVSASFRADLPPVTPPVVTPPPACAATTHAARAQAGHLAGA